MVGSHVISMVIKWDIDVGIRNVCFEFAWPFSQHSFLNLLPHLVTCLTTMSRVHINGRPRNCMSGTAIGLDKVEGVNAVLAPVSDEAAHSVEWMAVLTVDKVWSEGSGSSRCFWRS